MKSALLGEHVLAMDQQDVEYERWKSWFAVGPTGSVIDAVVR